MDCHKLKYPNRNTSSFFVRKFGLILIVVTICLTLPSCSEYNNNRSEGNIIQLTNWYIYSGSDFISPSARKYNLKAIRTSDKWKPVSLNELQFSNVDKIVWLKTKVPEWNGNDPAIYFGPVFHSVQVFLNNDFVFQRGNFTTPEDKYIWWNQNLVQLPFYEKGDDLIFRIHIEENFKGIPERVYLGSSLEIAAAIFKQNFINILLIPVFLLCAAAALLLYIFLERTQIFFGLFLFLFLVSTQIIVNTPFFRLVFHYPAGFFHVNYISYHLISVSFYYLIAQIVEKYKSIINFMWKFRLALLFVSLAAFNLTDIIFYDTLKYIMPLNVLFLLTSMVILFLSTKKNKLKRNIFIFALTSIVVSLIVEFIMIFSWGINTDFGYSLRAFHFGAIIFVAAIIWLAYENYMDTKREKDRIHQREFEAVKRENEVRHNFTVRLLESQELERNRIALELHDSVGQKLLLIKNYMISLIKNYSDDKAMRTVVSAGKITDETIQEIRNITYNLRPQYIDQLGLTAAIETIIEKVSDMSEINFSMSIDNVDNLFFQTNEMNFFRIIQESINNIVKHSHADEAYVKIKRTEDMLLLEIKDNGIGLKENISSNDTLGLVGMKERANLLGAALNIISDKNGTTIKMEYKINQAAEKC